tara:strand:+ start:37 stop:1200 length:1164 start_codon:yes stop_codon:yes gene_type:complete
MAITDKKPGVWGLDQVYNKINQGSIWSYEEPLQLWSWGNNSEGMLGQNNTTKYSSPVQIGSATNWASLVSTESMVGGVNDSGELFTWGRNSAGQLGQNTPTASKSSPTQVPGTTWDALKFRGGCAQQVSLVKTDGTLWSWGYSWYGRTGTLINDGAQISSPVQIPGTTWASNFTHSRGGGAIRTDGTLWMWGIGAEGNLAQNNTTYYSSPIQIPGTTWKQGCGNGSGVAAVKTNGTLWVWGRGNDGTGANDRVNYSSPIQIPGTTWESVGNGGTNHKLATKTDGTLWAWGLNNWGQLGQNDVQPGDGGYSSPVQIPGTTWNYIASGFGTLTAVIKTDGTLWAWGNNGNGQLGQNDVVAHSSPVQVPGTNWKYAITNSSSIVALGYQG